MVQVIDALCATCQTCCIPETTNFPANQLNNHLDKLFKIQSSKHLHKTVELKFHDKRADDSHLYFVNC